MSDTLVVVDDEYASLSDAYAEWARRVESLYESYIQCLSTVLKNAIPAGRTFENLQAFASSASLLGGQFQQVALALAAECTAFVERVDIDDKYLYRAL